MKKLAIQALAMARVLYDDLSLGVVSASEGLLITAGVCASIVWLTYLCGFLCRLFGV